MFTSGSTSCSVVVGTGASELAQKDTDIITVFPESLVSGRAGQHFLYFS